MLIEEARFLASEKAKPSNSGLCWSVSTSDSEISITAVSASDTGVVLPDEKGDLRRAGNFSAVPAAMGAGDDDADDDVTIGATVVRLPPVTFLRSDGMGGRRLWIDVGSALKTMDIWVWFSSILKS